LREGNDCIGRLTGQSISKWFRNFRRKPKALWQTGKTLTNNHYYLTLLNRQIKVTIDRPEKVFCLDVFTNLLLEEFSCSYRSLRPRDRGINLIKHILEEISRFNVTSVEIAGSH
jgi:hypothetical protein